MTALLVALLLASDPVTPNMGLTVPTCGVTPGACCGAGCYPYEIEGNFNLIDSLAYSLGNPVPTAGLNINANVDFHGYSILDGGIGHFSSVLTPSLDTPSDGGLTIGGTNAGGITIGKSGVTTSVLGPVNGIDFCSATSGGCMTPGTASAATTIQAPEGQCVALDPDGGAAGVGPNAVSFCGQASYIPTPLAVDGGVTAMGFTLGGSGCETLPTGAALCGDGAGGAALTAVDGGSVEIPSAVKFGAGATIIVSGGATPTIGTDGGDLTLAPASTVVHVPYLYATGLEGSAGGAAVMPNGAELGTSNDNWLWAEGQAGGNWPILLVQTTAGVNPDAGVNIQTLGVSGVDISPAGANHDFIGTTEALGANDSYLCLGNDHTTCTGENFAVMSDGINLDLNAPEASGSVKLSADGGAAASFAPASSSCQGSFTAGVSSTDGVELLGGVGGGTVESTGGTLTCSASTTLQLSGDGSSYFDTTSSLGPGSTLFTISNGTTAAAQFVAGDAGVISGHQLGAGLDVWHFNGAGNAPSVSSPPPACFGTGAATTLTFGVDAAGTIAIVIGSVPTQCAALTTLVTVTLSGDYQSSHFVPIAQPLGVSFAATQLQAIATSNRQFVIQNLVAFTPSANAGINYITMGAGTAY